jgi:hypothetical protein
MADSSTERERISQRRARRRAKEIVIAAVLTIAAVAFIAAAFWRAGGSPAEPEPFSTARKPPA